MAQTSPAAPPPVPLPPLGARQTQEAPKTQEALKNQEARQTKEARQTQEEQEPHQAL